MTEGELFVAGVTNGTLATKLWKRQHLQLLVEETAFSDRQ
jgi:hypothetical protein